MWSPGNSSGAKKWLCPEAVWEGSCESTGEAQQSAFSLGLTKASDLQEEQRQLLWAGVWAALLFLVVQRAKNKRRSPGLPGLQPQPQPLGVLHRLLPVHMHPSTWHGSLQTHPVWSSLLSACTHLPKGKPLSKIESLRFYT